MLQKGHTTPPLYAVEVVSYGNPQNVSTLTTLMPFTDLGSENQSVTVHLYNLDGTNSVTLTVDVSHGGFQPNLDRRQSKTIEASSEGSIELHQPMHYTYVRIAAETASPSFPVVQVKWAVITQQR